MNSSAAGEYRVHVTFNPDAPCASPDPVQSLDTMGADFKSITMAFSPPDDVGAS